MFFRKAIIFYCLIAILAVAQEFYPVNSCINEPDPIASPNAVKGGSITEYIGPSPKSLNYYLASDTISSQIFDAMYESLLNLNSQTLEYDRCLAIKWSLSADKMDFTFWLDPEARWSDGKPITVEDVVWTYQAITNPANLTGPHKLSLDRLEPPVIVDHGKAIRFHAKKLHWQNLGAAGGFAILPKHIFAGKDFTKINFKFPVVSGPYRIKELQDGQFITMARRPDWWRAKWPNQQGLYNFDEIKYRFFEDRENAFSAFKKGEIDVFPIYTASHWHQIENKIEAVRKNWIVKQAIYNHRPVGLQGFAMNMRHAPFNDVKVREAMACLLDRDMLNRTMMHNQYFLHKSYWEDLYSADTPCTNPVLSFNPTKAKKLLQEAGWKMNPNTGRMEKNGEPFVFSFLSRNSSTEKYLVAFNENLKKCGIQMNIQNKDWAAWSKDMDSFSFDMTWLSWGAGLFKDPEYSWSSAQANTPGSQNVCGFIDQKVDAYIEQQKSIFDVHKRHAICRQIDAILTRQFPYILLWNINYTRMLYWNKFGTPKTIIGKYSSESIDYWWADEDAEADLLDAMDHQEPLPALPNKIIYDNAIKK
ncbi:MAG: extracellular solute-binding protein [Lentisphaeria bacterium]